MALTVNQFIKDYQAAALHMFAEPLENLSQPQQYAVLAFLTKGYAAPDWAKTKALYDHSGQKQVYYFSIEFLPGRMLGSNLLSLGIKETVEDGLKQLKIDADALYAAEPDPALGNGGLGRLASAFLDAMAAVGMAGNGNGIRYQYGLFKQRFVDGYQVELPDDWLRNPNVWETRKENRAVIVRFGGSVYMAPTGDGLLRPVYEGAEEVLAVPYDTAVIGYRDHVVNNLRLWAAEPVPSDHGTSIEEKARINQITQILYPDDSDTAGRQLRLRQEYFFTSAGIQSIMFHFHRFHDDIRQLPKYIAIHINDTHPAMAIPELMRILLDDEHLDWETAWEITVQTMSYTNHTLLSEALETWDQGLFKQLLPRIYQIIEEMDRRFREEWTRQYGELLVARTAPLGDGRVRMAYIAVIGSHAVNGVAKLHSDLLTTSVLKDLYTLYPKRFSNKTNGITPRRWTQLANRPLSQLLDETLGTAWRKQPLAIQGLRRYATDEKVLRQLMAAKHENKVALAQYIEQTLGLKVDPDAIFDVQIKRLHAYKRQLLHVFGILEAYRALKNGEKRPKRLHIFAAKAAPSYIYAKQIIKLINAVADLVNNDPDVNGQLQVAFLPNYGVTLAERIIPAADVSEQISLAGLEASGTSNMKLMGAGAITLATLDGANIEIAQAVGEENAAIFGLRIDEVQAQQADYHAAALYDSDPTLKAVVDMLIDGSIPGIEAEGRDIYQSLIDYNDQYFVLADFASYVAAQKKVDAWYQKPQEWAKAALINIAESGKFSADFTVARYGREIWDVLPRFGQEGPADV